MNEEQQQKKNQQQEEPSFFSWENIKGILQSPEFQAMGMGLLKSKEPTFGGALTDGLEAYHQAKQNKAQQEMQKQWMQNQMSLNQAKTQKALGEAALWRRLSDELGIDLGMVGGGIPVGGGASMLPQPSSPQDIPTNQGMVQPTSVPMSEDAKIAANYQLQGGPINLEGEGQQIKQDQNIQRMPIGPNQQSQTTKAIAPQRQGSLKNLTKEQQIGVMAALASGKPGDIYSILQNKKDLHVTNLMDPITKQPYVALVDKGTGETIPIPGAVPYEKQENQVLKELEKEYVKRTSETLNEFTAQANASQKSTNEANQVLAFIDKHGDKIQSGPGTEEFTKYKNFLANLGIGESDGVQEAFNKVVGKLITGSMGLIRDQGVRTVTQGEIMNLLPTITATLGNTPEGIKAILELQVALDGPIQKARKLAAEKNKEYMEYMRKGETPPFDLEQAYIEIGDLLSSDLNAEVNQFMEYLGSK